MKATVSSATLQTIDTPIEPACHTEDRTNRMMTTTCIVAMIVSAAAGDTTAVIGIGENPPNEAAIERVAADQRGGGALVIARTEVLRRLTGTSEARAPNIAALEQMLIDARDREARFDTSAANAVRFEILKTFDLAARPSDEHRRIAAAAAQDMAAALLADGNEQGALLKAQDALRRFSSVPLDPARHSPSVHRVFARAAAALADGPQGTLTVTCDAHGTIIADGNLLGPIATRLEKRLPVGNYRIWWVDASGTSSLPHAVEINTDGASVNVAAALESSLLLDPVISLQCGSDCEDLMVATGRHLGVDRIVGVFRTVGEDSHGLVVDVATGNVEPWGTKHTPIGPAAADLNLSRRAAFSPLYLVPFGVGQFMQERPLFGGAYAAIDGGLLVWHLVTWQRHSKAVSNDDFRHEPDLRSRRNLTAIIFYGALAATIAEAVIVGLITGD